VVGKDLEVQGAGSRKDVRRNQPRLALPALSSRSTHNDIIAIPTVVSAVFYYFISIYPAPAEV
jgi:hypothetical protein